MLQRAMPLLALVVLASPAGCSLNGTWKAVRFEPADAADAAPFRMVTFAEGQFSATRQAGDRLITSTGKFTWDGVKLTLEPSQGEKRVYPGRLNPFTRELALSHEADDQTVTAYFKKEPEP